MAFDFKMNFHIPSFIRTDRGLTLLFSQ